LEGFDGTTAYSDADGDEEATILDVATLFDGP